MSKGGGQEWFYHAPASYKNSEKKLAPAASQIPGLSSQDKEAQDRETGTYKRNLFVNNDDSKYIKLAKQGGRKNLLTFSDTKKSLDQGPKMYPRVDWFDHTPMSTEDEEKILARGNWNPPEYMVHESYGGEPEAVTKYKVDLGLAQKERREIQQKYEGQGIPFDTDDKSVWRREFDDLKNKDSGNTVKLPPIDEKKLMPKNGNFNKIMSGWYGNEWLKDESVQQKGRLKKIEAQHKNIHSGRYNLTEYQENICKQNFFKPKTISPRKYPKPQRSVQEQSKAEAKPFKLSKFDKIPSKLVTRASAS